VPASPGRFQQLLNTQKHRRSAAGLFLRGGKAMNNTITIEVVVNEKPYRVVANAHGGIVGVTTRVETWNSYYDRRIYDGYERKPPNKTARAAIEAARAQLQTRLAALTQEDVNRIAEEVAFDPEFHAEVRRRLEAMKKEQ
jgi:hypothetical protein